MISYLHLSPECDKASRSPSLTDLQRVRSSDNDGRFSAVSTDHDSLVGDIDAVGAVKPVVVWVVIAVMLKLKFVFVMVMMAIVR